MNKTAVEFNTTALLKRRMLQRAKRDGTSIAEVLERTLVLYAEGVFSPRDFNKNPPRSKEYQ